MCNLKGRDCCCWVWWQKGNLARNARAVIPLGERHSCLDFIMMSHYVKESSSQANLVTRKKKFIETVTPVSHFVAWLLKKGWKIDSPYLPGRIASAVASQSRVSKYLEVLRSWGYASASRQSFVWSLVRFLTMYEKAWTFIVDANEDDQAAHCLGLEEDFKFDWARFQQRIVALREFGNTLKKDVRRDTKTRKTKEQFIAEGKIWSNARV